MLGVDILGPFPLAPGQWIEVEPIASILAERVRIKQSFTSVEHPQSNEQTEVTTRVILRGLRRRLEESKGCWVEELSQIEEASQRVSLFQNKNNEVELRANLDLLQEEREMAYIQEFITKARVARRYNNGFPTPYLKRCPSLAKNPHGGSHEQVNAQLGRSIQSLRGGRAGNI
ncbi:hypothetical protein CR513_21813, partial [Mucuna pruriens]